MEKRSFYYISEVYEVENPSRYLPIVIHILKYLWNVFPRAFTLLFCVLCWVEKLFIILFLFYSIPVKNLPLVHFTVVMLMC